MPPVPPAQAAAATAQHGIQPVALRLTAAGHMLDFRYRLTDPAQAAAQLQPGLKPHVINQRTGSKLTVPTAPKIGTLRQVPQQPDAERVYFALFGNGNPAVKAGDKVTVVLGDCVWPDLVVE
jgi:hypothetical protein